MTESEYLLLREKYFCPEYYEKLIIDTREFPKKIIVIDATRIASKFDYHFYITEITKEALINYIYTDELKICTEWLGSVLLKESNIVFLGDTYSNIFQFFISYSQCFSKIWVYVQYMNYVYDPVFFDLLAVLKQYNIPIRGLIEILLTSNHRKLVSSNRLIQDNFGVKIPTLRVLISLLEKNLAGDLVGSFTAVKSLFSCSDKQACEYIDLIKWEDKERINKNLLSKESKKELRRYYNYLHTIKTLKPELVNMYLDYIMFRDSIVNHNISNFPKYPKDVNKLASLHDKVFEIFKEEKVYREKNLLSTMQISYEAFYKKAKMFEFSDSEYSIIAVKDLKDLITEGKELHHCVSSYIESVGKGKEYILFLRQTPNLKTPYFTIDITPDGKVRQIHGYCNCDITDEISPFIKKWAAKFNLDISNFSKVCTPL